MKSTLDRRSFLKGVGIATGALGSMAIAGCASPSKKSDSSSSSSSSSGSESDAAWRQAPEAITDFSQTVDADIVIIGAGNSGMTAAARALDGGANVVILEAESTVQDSRSWIGAIDSKLQKAAGVEIDHNEAAAEICRMASYTAKQEIIRKWTDNSGEFMDWFIDVMETQDLHVMLETACKDSVYYNKAVGHHVYKGTYNPTGEGNSFYHHCEALESYINSKGGTFYFSTPASQLILDDSGKVTGVVAESSDGSYIRFNASKGVVVATGGYGNNEEMLNDLTNTANRYCSMNIGATRNVGDGIKMLTWAGASLHPVQETMVFDRGTLPTGATLDFPFSGGLWYGGTQPFLRVNELGERYSNEDQTYDYNFNAAIVQPGHTWWQVFDANYYADCERFQCARCSRVAAPKQGEAPMISYLDGETPLTSDFLTKQLDNIVSTGAGVKADTIEDLANQMGIDATTFKATVERYNELYAASEGLEDDDTSADVDFGKKAMRLSAIKQGPFYAVHSAGWLLCSLGGINVNYDLQPLREDGTAIEGVYVIGNDQGGFYGTVYPETFGGLNNGKGMTFGYLIGKSLSEG